MQAHNKALKRDSCRVAFLVCGDFCGENGLRKAGLCGTHPLTRRYGFLKSDTVWINSICCLCSIRCVKYCFYFNLSGHNECVNPYVVKC
ncbi:DUF3265 domain-containing protein [Vibrio vulnificus]|nr:DUF3265 domain-containing protein [Vibrio vulnificus]